MSTAEGIVLTVAIVLLGGILAKLIWAPKVDQDLDEDEELEGSGTYNRWSRAGRRRF